MKVGDEADLQLLLELSPPLRGMPLELSFDSARLQVLGINEGELLRRDGQDIAFSSSLDAKARSVLDDGAAAVTGDHPSRMRDRGRRLPLHPAARAVRRPIRSVAGGCEA